MLQSANIYPLHSEKGEVFRKKEKGKRKGKNIRQDFKSLAFTYSLVENVNYHSSEYA